MNMYEYFNRLVSVYSYDDYLREKFTDTIQATPVIINKGSSDKGYSMEIELKGYTGEIYQDDFLCFYDKAGTIPDLSGGVKAYETLRVITATGNTAKCSERISYEGTHFAYDDDFYSQVLPNLAIALPTRTFLYASYEDFTQEKTEKESDAEAWTIMLAPVIDNTGTVGVVSGSPHTNTNQLGVVGSPVTILENFEVVVRVPAKDNQTRMEAFQEVQAELLQRILRVFTTMPVNQTEELSVQPPTFAGWSIQHGLEGYWDISYEFEVVTRSDGFARYPTSGNHLRAFKHAEGSIRHGVSGGVSP